MTHAASPPDGARLDELAAVTREYAAYSRTAYGLGFVGTGVAVLATAALDLATARSPWARVAYVLLPAVWLVSVAAARAYYQRHGAVVQPEQRMPGRVWHLALVCLVCGAEAFTLTAAGPAWFHGDWSHMAGAIVAAFAVVAVPMLAAEVARGHGDIQVTVTLAGVSMFAGMFPDLPTRTREMESLKQAISIIRGGLVLLLCFCAVIAVVGGLRQHRSYARLERRLAALKGTER